LNGKGPTGGIYEREGESSVFGILRLRDIQELAVLRSGADCVVLMRTSGGKFVCLLPPSLTFLCVTDIVSPLRVITHEKIKKVTARHNGAAFMTAIHRASFS
jgi:superfamily II DNA helicase RecQ